MAGATKAERNHYGWVTLFGWEDSMEIPKTRFGRQLYARVRSLIRSRRPAALGRDLPRWSPELIPFESDVSWLALFRSASRMAQAMRQLRRIGTRAY